MKWRSVVLTLILVGVTTACGSVQTPAEFLQFGMSTATVTPTPAADVAPASTTSQNVGAATTVPVSLDTAAAHLADTELESTLIDLYAQANPSVVYILVSTAGGGGSGSGFVYDANNGYIVTNNHVIENARDIEVVFAGGERRTAEVIGADVDGDLAVLQVDVPAGVPALPLADPDSIVVGQFAVAIGNPFGEQGSMSFGIVSGLDRSLPSQRGFGANAGSTYSLPEIIQTDAPINPGNSGGPLLNLKGEVVGITSSIASTTGTNSGVGFAIPVRAVRRIVPSLIDTGGYDYPYMGASFDGEVTLSEQSSYGLSQTEGAYVVGVAPGGPADEAGIEPADNTTGRGGDLVVAIDGQPITDFSDLNSYLVFNTGVGQTIDVTVLRDGTQITLPLTLAERP